MPSHTNLLFVLKWQARESSCTLFESYLKVKFQEAREELVDMIFTGPLGFELCESPLTKDRLSILSYLTVTQFCEKPCFVNFWKFFDFVLKFCKIVSSTGRRHIHPFCGIHYVSVDDIYASDTQIFCYN